MKPELQAFIYRFVGKKDKWLDSFRILSAPEGLLFGDCDDFACTALWIQADKSLWRFWFWLLIGRARIWRSWSVNGVPHAVLWVKDVGYIDNLAPEWAEMTPHKLRWTRPVGVVALKMLVGKLIG